MTITLDTKSTTALTKDNRNSAGSFTSDTRLFSYLWVVTTFPWTEQFPWQISGDGQVLLKDIRN